MSKVKNKLVSVVIPTYQRPKYFIEALESVLAQSHSNLEIFVTDNSHNTDTKEAIKKYIKQDSRIIYEHHPEYMSARENWTRAKAYDNQKAEYVQWLMDDDMLFPTKIEDMLEVYCYDPTIALVTSPRRAIDAEGSFIEDMNPLACRKDNVYYGKDICNIMLKTMTNFIGEPSTAFIKKNNQYKNTLGWAPTANTAYNISDFPTWLACLEHGDLYYMAEPKSYYRVHPGQQQRQVATVISCIICWANCLMYAIEKNIYVKRLDDIKQAIQSWDRNLTFAVECIEKENYNDTCRINDLLLTDDKINKFRQHN